MTDQASLFEMVVKTQAGLEEILAEELKAVGASDIEIITRAVKCKGDQEVMYKANYLCRTAVKVLKPFAYFEIEDEDSLYKQCKELPWSMFLSTDKTFAVDSTVNSKIITHSKFAGLRVKDAIADFFREDSGRRPNVNIKNPDVLISLHVYNNSVTMSLDSSGDSLHKRNYRVAQGEAPINEVLAAGLIALSGWDGKSPFYDPMCGSGTILIEAAMLAMNMPAGYYRQKFGFQGWFDYDEALFNKIVDEAVEQISDEEIEIYGSDISPRTLRICQQNLEHAKLHKDVVIRNYAMDQIIPEEPGGQLIINPPYNERISLDNQIEFYKMIGNSLKRNFTGFKAGIITSNMDSLKFVGLKPSKKTKMFNGPLECRFAEYELYSGTKKIHKMRD
jgi:putative N6-adenine-specific DNA methylase